MSHSIYVQLEVTCSNCGEVFIFDVWTVVDVSERPELLEKMREGTLHEVICPRCKQSLGYPDSPILIYRPDDRYGMIFSPARFATAEQTVTHVKELLDYARQNIGEIKQTDESKLKVVYAERDLLPDILAPGAEPVEYQPPENIAADEKGAFPAREDAQQSVLDPSLLQAIRNLMIAPTRAATREILEQHPDLMTDEVSAFMKEWAETQKVENVRDLIEHYRAMLSRCREVGIEQTLFDDRHVFEEDPAEEYFQNYPAEVRKVISGLAERGLSVSVRPASSGSKINPMTVDHDAGVPQLSPAAAEKLTQAITIHGLLRWDRSEPVVRAAVEAWWRFISDPEVLGAPFWHVLALNELSDSLIYCIRELGETDKVDEAIATCQTALEIAGDGTPEKTITYSYLAVVLRIRFEVQGDVADLNTAIKSVNKAISATPEGSIDWDTMHANLGLILVRRFEALGELADLDSAILHIRKSLSVREEGSHGWSAGLAFLGMALSHRFTALKLKSDIDAALDTFRKALALTHKESIDWSRAQNNVAYALWSRYDSFHDMADLDNCISHLEESIKSSPDGSPSQTISRANLANQSHPPL